MVLWLTNQSTLDKSLLFYGSSSVSLCEQEEVSLAMVSHSSCFPEEEGREETQLLSTHQSQVVPRLPHNTHIDPIPGTLLEGGDTRNFQIQRHIPLITPESGDPALALF